MTLSSQQQDPFIQYDFAFDDTAVRFKLIPPRPETSDDSYDIPVYHIEVLGADNRHLGTIKVPCKNEEIMVILIVSGILVLRFYDRPD